MANKRYQQNSHKWQTWPLLTVGLPVTSVTRLFHNAIVSQCDHFFAATYVFVVWNGRRLLFKQQLLNNFLDFFHFWHDCWPWPIDYLISFWLIFIVTLTLNFQGQIWNLLHLSQKWSDCHETKNKHINWNLGLKCDHRVWPWPWPWPWIFKGKYRICYISAKNGLIATKRKSNISIELKASNMTIKFDLGHDLDLEFSRSNIEFAISQPKMARLPRNEKQTYRLNSMPQMWRSALTLAMTLTLNFQGQIWNLLYLSQNSNSNSNWFISLKEYGVM